MKSQSIILLTISGDMFYFANDNFTCEQLNLLGSFAENIFNINPELKELNEDELCDWFINATCERMDIILKKLEVSFVIRINL